MNLIERATALRSSAELGAQYLPDEKALQAKVLYKQWSELVLMGTVTADAGYKFLHGEDLYKCINANPTFQADWVPGVGTESLYTRIDEIHAGTIDDPIPYSTNMEIFEGCYYTQYDVLYYCNRSSGAPLHHDLSALVGLYVMVAEAEE